MPFWSSVRLRQRRGEILHPHPTDADCQEACYILHVGEEAYVTPHTDHPDGQSQTKRHLKAKESISIPAGQFAYLLTEETVTIPFNVIGFISIKAKKKLCGLINVSGFHVDPGYNGKLIFAVYNAGPQPVHVQRGEGLFMLWLADLDSAAQPEDARNNTSQSSYTNIPGNVIISGPIYSLQGLSKKIEKMDVALNLFKERWKVIGAIVIALIVFLLRGPILEEINKLSKGGDVRAIGSAAEEKAIEPPPATKPPPSR